MGAAVMAKRKRIEPEATEQPATTRLVPKSNAGECTACPAWRKQLNRENSTVIYCTRGRTRYCKCLNCGSTWKIVE